MSPFPSIDFFLGCLQTFLSFRVRWYLHTFRESMVSLQIVSGTNFETTLINPKFSVESSLGLCTINIHRNASQEELPSFYNLFVFKPPYFVTPEATVPAENGFVLSFLKQYFF